MKRYTAQRGQVLPLVAILVVVLMGFAALAVDVGYHRYSQRVQQSATDSAALAGAWELGSGHMVSSAQYDASKNGFTDNTVNASCTVCVAASNPPSKGPYSSDPTAVEVNITATRPTFFERVFSINSVKIHTRAVARKVANNNGCVYLLSPTENTNFNKGTVLAANCALYSNGTVNTNGATVTDQQFAIYNVAGSNTSGISNFTHVTSYIQDPCIQIDGCLYLQTNPPATTSCPDQTVDGTKAQAFAIAGCYNNLTLKGNVQLGAGLYTITGSLTANGANLTSAPNGVTIYVGPSASLNFDKTTTINLSAPTSGNTNGVLFYQVPSNTTDPNFNKAASAAFSGLLYFPGVGGGTTGCLNFNKSTSAYAVLVAGCVNFNKGSETFNGPTSSSSLIKDAVLAE